MKILSLRAYWLTCVLTILALAGSASATTIVMPDDAQLIAKSPLIVEGEVVATAPVESDGKIWTETTVAVSRTWKGSASSSVTIREIGGIVGDRITKIFGAPEYTAGEHVLLFLTPTPRGDYQTIDLFAGKFTEEQMLDGRRLWSRHDEAAEAVLLDAAFRPIHARNVQREAAGFERFVADRVAGREGSRNYGIENPVLEGRGGNGGRLALPKFTLISEPSVYRWFTFQNGGTANWYTYGTQPGYTGGGVSEVQSAMAAWNNYSSAKISYAYAGQTSTPSTGLTKPNGKNEILFNDPNNEIAGSWNPATGGVVGQGGFNGVAGGGSWTSPFAADSSHPQQTYNAVNITEGNLVIQDNVSPNANLSSNRLAEIIAHEFGHTLGFGHSADGTALMYATVTGLGPSLRADDQVAARWLYPNGSVAPPPSVTIPASPSNLSATAQGTSVVLQWSDNASNETIQTVYYAVGSGSFTKVADVAAGSTTATLSGFTAGTYRFYVTASNSAGTSAASNTATATVGTQVTAAFAVSPSSGVAGQTLFTFTDQTSGSITSRSWNFGDGSVASAAAVTHTYSSAGTYNVTLTVVAGGTQSTATRLINVSAPPVPATPPVSASFDFAPASPRAGELVSFSDRSSGSPASWSWSFGDGTTATGANPTHAFATAGVYSVTLTASNGSSTGTATRTISVAQNIGVFRSLVSAAAQTNGAGGSVWRTELTIFNAGDSVVSTTLVFLPGSGSGVQSRTINLLPKQSVVYANALLDIYGIPSGSGAITIEGTSSSETPRLKVTSRTFTSGAVGTYGQSVPDVAPDELTANLYLTGLISNSAFRTNIGLVNRGSSDTTAELTLYLPNGNPLGTHSVYVPARSYFQLPLTDTFIQARGGSYESLSVRIAGSQAGVLSVYASVIDNRTQDPVYVQASPLPANATQVIPAVGRAAGANDTYWRSDVAVFNPSSSAVVITARFGGRSASFALGARQTQWITDVVAWLGLASGSGALEMTSSGTPAVITSRTYTTAAGGGTYGQSIDPVAAWRSEVFVPGLRSDASFRSNAGFVNNGDAETGVSLSLIGTAGQTLGTAFVVVPAKSQIQTSVAALFPNVPVAAIGSFTLRAESGNGALFAYGSIVDQASGDPVFFPGE
jgi:PKD repeat protein